jgi:hypothetical protein
MTYSREDHSAAIVLCERSGRFRVGLPVSTAGKILGSGLGANPQFAKTLIECGVQWMQAGNDFEYLIKGCERTSREIRGSDS